MKTKEKISLISLIIANIYPIFGVLFLNWNLSSILFLYWFENIIIGFYNVLKMYKAEIKDDTETEVTSAGIINRDISKESTIVFFILHYGIFTYCHQKILFTYLINDLSVNATLLIGCASLFISHGISYFNNYIKKEEYKNVGPKKLMAAPYIRIVTMHTTVIIGSILVDIFNEQTIVPLIVLTIFKTSVDLFSHIYEHNKYKSTNKHGGVFTI